jgi:hypothetical protein
VISARGRYRLGLRLWVTSAVAMALAASVSTLALLYLQRPFIAERGGLAPGAYEMLFLTAIAAGARRRVDTAAVGHRGTNGSRRARR